ncbi:Calcineurin-like phosphoesterase-like protein 1 [Elsinoe fawcettii]|nr:Calcineurin-like phosphoesterase-like protein 1 [Elsinoe fawcettii]
MATVPTSVLVISDTHLASPFPLGVPADLHHIDVLVHTGDLTMLGTVSEYHQALDMLATIPADIKLVIPGNHDLALDREWLARTPERLRSWERRNGVPSWKGRLGNEQWEEAEAVWFGEESRAVREGVTMLKEGRHEIRLKNGALLKVWASPYQPEFCDWAFPYGRNEDRFNSPGYSLSDATNIAMNPVDQNSRDDKPGRIPVGDIDIMMTHGPPYGRLDLTLRGPKVGCPHLLAAVSQVRPRLHCFGHIHEGWGVERLFWDDERIPTASPSSNTTESFMKAWDSIENQNVVEKIVVEAYRKTLAPGPVLVDLTARAGQPMKPGTTTTLVNAAIMDISYMPINLPILLSIDIRTT